MEPKVRVRRLDGSPDLLAVHRANPARYPYLLESVTYHPERARYDILFGFPGETLQLAANGTVSIGDRIVPETGFLPELDNWFATEGLPPGAGPPLPFRGGWFVYLGYELAGEVEPRLRLPPAMDTFPTAFATRIPAALVHDRRERCVWLVAEPEYPECLDRMQADLASAAQRAWSCMAPPGVVHEEDPATYKKAVARIKRYIRDGDVFQVNLSRTWQLDADATIDPGSLYALLREHNPAPFSGLVRFGGQSICSSSPERLVRVQGDRVETRPIAGTRPRGTDGAGDRRYSEQLLTHPKERAEHIMLIDLERNDLGRICATGSVEVNELMVLESYAHVHHIVSSVRGRLRPDVTPGQVIRAVFPGGTITGCPKVRCMEIIAELEAVGRGPYTGSMGYLNRDGDLDLNILIRTIVTDGRRLSVRAGAGIVADSEADREVEETRAKALGMLLALGGQSSGKTAVSNS